MLDGESVKADKFDADYAKVVLNDDDEIVWAEGFKLDGFILVDEVKDDKIIGYNDDELKIKDFTIVKEGKTILAADLEDQDIVFFNSSEDFAVVSNNGKEGELDRVYTDGTFRFEGSAYSKSAIAAPMYFDDGKAGTLDANILADFLDDEVTITVFVDFAGKVVLVSGEVSSVGNSAYAVVTKNTTKYTGRKGDMVALDVRNGANEKVAYDIVAADLDDIAGLTFAGANYDSINDSGVLTTFMNKLTTGVVVKLTVNKDGDLTKIEFPEHVNTAKAFKIADANVKGTDDYSYRLQSSTIVFYDSNKKVTTLGNAKDVFSEVKSGATIYIDKGYVVAVVGETDTDADTKDVTGLVTNVKAVSGGKLQFTIKVFGATQRILTESKTLNEAQHKSKYENKIATLVVGETSDEIKSFGTVKTNAQPFKIESISGRTITPVSGTAVELNNNAVIYDNGLDAINLRDLKKDMTITVYFQGSSNRFVDYVITGTVSGTPSDVTGLVTYVNGATTSFAVDTDTIYTIGAETVFRDKDNAIKAIGLAEITNIAKVNPALAEGDQVEVKAKDGVATEIKRISTLAERNAAGLKAAAKAALNNAIINAKALVEADYKVTGANSWAAQDIPAAIIAAEAVYNNVASDTSDYTSAKSTLEGKVNGLEFKGLANLDIEIGLNGNGGILAGNHTSVSWSAYQLELSKANLAKTENKSNAALVTATEDLEAAREALVIKDFATSAVTLAGTNTKVTVTLTNAEFKAGTISATDFVFVGDDKAVLEGATFARTSDTEVTITFTADIANDGTNNVITVKGATITEPTGAISVGAVAAN